MLDQPCFLVLLPQSSVPHNALTRTYTVEWDGTSEDNRFEIDLYYCGSYCMTVSATDNRS